MSYQDTVSGEVNDSRDRDHGRNQQEPESLVEFVQEKPLTAVIAAAFVGFVLARIVF